MHIPEFGLRLPHMAPQHASPLPARGTFVTTPCVAVDSPKLLCRQPHANHPWRCATCRSPKPTTTVSDTSGGGGVEGHIVLHTQPVEVVLMRQHLVSCFMWLDVVLGKM